MTCIFVYLVFTIIYKWIAWDSLQSGIYPTRLGYTAYLIPLIYPYTTNKYPSYTSSRPYDRSIRPAFKRCITVTTFSGPVVSISKRCFASCSWFSLVSWKNMHFFEDDRSHDHKLSTSGSPYMEVVLYPSDDKKTFVNTWCQS